MSKNTIDKILLFRLTNILVIIILRVRQVT